MNRLEFIHDDGRAPTLLLRRQAAEGPPVLYVHGATFPSALSVAWRFDGHSWMDDLAMHRFDAWAFDFAGYGGSDRPAGMELDREGPPIGRAPEAAAQIARVVMHIVEATGHDRISLIAHSWGSIPAALFATQRPGRIEKLCLFGPIVCRNMLGLPPASAFGRWRLVTVAEQLARFVEDVPRGRPPVLIEPELHAWGPAYLASDPDAQSRTPPAVKIPGGPAADIIAAWFGEIAWRPQDIRAPTLLVRGEWDGVCTENDIDRLQPLIPNARRITIREATHLMHLEHARENLFAAVRQFLQAPEA